MEHSILVGLYGVVLICLSQGIALPAVKRLEDDCSAGQLLVIRGVTTVLITLIIIQVTGGTILPANAWVIGMAVTFSLAALGLYKAIQIWDGSLAITIVTATPVVNFIFALFRGKNIEPIGVVSLILLLAGVAIALKAWEWDKNSVHSVRGIMWIIFGTVMNGLFYECLSLAQTKSSGGTSSMFFNALPLAFWQGIAVSLIGVATARNARWTIVRTKPGLWPKLILFGLLAGFVYFIGNILTFGNIELVYASILVQIETPFVIMMMNVIVPKDKRLKLTLIQYCGIAIALTAGTYLGYWLQQ